MFAIGRGHQNCPSHSGDCCHHHPVISRSKASEVNRERGHRKAKVVNDSSSPRSSRSLASSSAALIAGLESHGDHFHEKMVGWKQVQNEKGNVLAQLYTREDQEGCPCCTAGLDFDEFAVAVKELMGNVETQHGLVEWSEFDSAAHWSVFLGVSAPLSLLGLTAASRNIRGCLKNREAISTLIGGVDKAIETNRDKLDVVQRLKAFRKTLSYSKFDADFNLVVPGVVNGVASSLVLSTALLSHPFALPAICLYATSQLGRNLYDFKRVLRDNVKILKQDTPEIALGKATANRVNCSRIKFNAVNATGFLVFAGGALVTFLSLPALGVAGLGVTGLIVGLSFLGFGAIFTGITNNIWPRKLRPRNGDLGVDRVNLDEVKCLQEIASRKQLKTHLKELKAVYDLGGGWTRFNYMVRSAMPRFEDFLSQKVAGKLSNLFGFFPRTGSLAVAHFHEIQKQKILQLHQDKNQSLANVRKRNGTLLSMRDVKGDNHVYCPVIRDRNDCKDQLLETWEHLQWLGLGEGAICTYLNENFVNGLKLNQSECSVGGGEQSEEGVCQEIAGLQDEEDRFTWSMEGFLSESGSQEIQHLNAAIDFFLVNTLLEKITYQQYGLVDFFHAMRRAMRSDLRMAATGSQAEEQELVLQVKQEEAACRIEDSFERGTGAHNAGTRKMHERVLNSSVPMLGRFPVLTFEDRNSPASREVASIIQGSVDRNGLKISGLGIDATAFSPDSSWAGKVEGVNGYEGLKGGIKSVRHFFKEPNLAVACSKLLPGLLMMPVYALDSFLDVGRKIGDFAFAKATDYSDSAAKEGGGNWGVKHFGAGVMMALGGAARVAMPLSGLCLLALANSSVLVGGGWMILGAALVGSFTVKEFVTIHKMGLGATQTVKTVRDGVSGAVFIGFAPFYFLRSFLGQTARKSAERSAPLDGHSSIQA